jgi:hypothetical protein
LAAEEEIRLSPAVLVLAEELLVRESIVHKFCLLAKLHLFWVVGSDGKNLVEWL